MPFDRTPSWSRPAFKRPHRIVVNSIEHGPTMRDRESVEVLVKSEIVGKGLILIAT